MATRAAKQPDRDPHAEREGHGQPAVIRSFRSRRPFQSGLWKRQVRISKQVREYEEVVDVPHYQEEVRVERFPITFVEAAPSVRTEGM